MIAVFGAGKVRIVDAGVPMQGTYLPTLDGRLRFQPVVKGEYYVTNCLYCNDTRKRLWINHCWGVRDARTGDRRYWLACCFNEDCLRLGDHLEDLKERLVNYDVQAGSGRVCLPMPTVVSTPVLRRVDLPDDFVLLSDLRRGHPARRYVRRRRFRPDELARDWGVGFSLSAYCLTSGGRLLIPLRARLPDEGWSVVGWQARAIEEETTPKYYTRPGTPKSKMLYGLEHVSDDDRPVLVCEGVTDVWRAGDNAVAVLGNHVSEAQARLLREYAGTRPLVLMLDPDAADEAETAAETLRAALRRSLHGGHPRSRVVVASLPGPSDPGDCTREEVWAAARKALARATKGGGR
jgi:hypothetical protein